MAPRSFCVHGVFIPLGSHFLCLSPFAFNSRLEPLSETHSNHEMNENINNKLTVLEDSSLTCQLLFKISFLLSRDGR